MGEGIAQIFLSDEYKCTELSNQLYIFKILKRKLKIIIGEKVSIDIFLRKEHKEMTNKFYRKDAQHH